MQFILADMYARLHIERLCLLLTLVFVLGKGAAWAVDAPTLVSPTNGATGQPVSLTLSWNAVAFADSYRVQVSTDSLFRTLSLERSVPHIAVAVQSTAIGPLPNDSLHFWRVRARDNSATFGLWSATWRFRIAATRPAVPVLFSPANLATSVPITDSLKWNADPIADSYRVQLSTSVLFVASAMVIDTTIPVAWGSSYQGIRLRGVLNKTKYYWRAMSRKGVDTSLWTSSWTFTTIVDTPSVPVLLTPAAGANSQPLNPTVLTWNAATDAVSYRLQVATDAGFTALIVSDSAVTGTNKQVNGLLNATRYYWRVNAKNVAATSGYSASWSFSTKLLSASPVAPANNGTNLSKNPTLRWTTSPGASTYRVQVSLAATMTPTLLNTLTASDSVMLQGLLNKTKYYWRVSAIGLGGDTSAYPPIAWNFTTIVDTPSVPVLLSPGNTSKSVAVTPTTFNWNAATDAATYRFQIASDTLFTAIVSEDTAVSSVTKQVNGLLPSTRYFWRVSAKNVAASTGYSAVWSFSTRPVAPSVMYPANNSTGQSTVPVLRWTSTPDVVTARIQVSTGTGFLPLTLDDTVAVDSVIIGPLANKTKFYWRVSARNANGDTSAFPATAWNFTTLVGLPGVPALTAPLMNAVSQSVNPTALSWNAATDATTYRLQVGLDSLFAAIVFDDSSLGSPAKQVTGLQFGTRYYWRVNAKNSAGTAAFSSWRAFTTILAPPAVIAPGNASTDQSVNPVLRWSPIAGATQYIVQLSKSTSFRPLLSQVVTAADSAVMGPLGNDSLYYWHVSARNATGDTSNYPQTPWSFRTKLATPLLTLPISGANGQAVNPTLSWYAVPGATIYRLQVSDDPGFPGTVIFDDPAISMTSRQVGPLNGSRTYYWRVNARNAAGTSTSAWSEIRNFVTRIDTPSTPVLQLPADNTLDVDFSPTFQWTQANGAAFYTFQMALDSQFLALVYERTPLIATSHQVGSLMPDTTYFWRVSAMNQAASASSPYSQPFSFRTRLDTPAVPVLLSPASRALAQPVSPLLRWNNARAASLYRVQLSTDSYFPVILFDTTVVRDTTVVLGPALTNGNRIANNTTYFWRVLSNNRLGSSAFSWPYNFTTVIGSPVPLSPLHGAVDQAARNLEFRWSPVAGARHYEFILAADTGFRSIVAKDTMLAGTSRTVDSLAVSTQYFWRVTARSDSNGTTQSPLSAFTTLITIPAVPQLSSPGRGVTNTPTTMMFQWLPSLGANTYRLQISTDSAFGIVIYDYPALSAPSYQVQTLAYSTTYYWRVSAANGNGSSAFSQPWAFTVTVPAPATPFLAAPLDGATDVALPAMLAWGQTAGAVTYRVRISTVADFSSIAFDTTTALTWVNVSSIATGSAHYWQVIAQNAGGSRTSAIWVFTTKIPAPTLPVPVSPANGSVNAPATQALAWTGGAGATAFHVQVARDSMFTLLVLNDSGIVDPTRTVGPLEGYTRYFWRVRGYNIGGSTPFTIPWTFRTVIGTPVLTAPLAGTMHVANKPVLRWRPVSGEPRYRVQIASDQLFSAVVVDVNGIVDTSFRSTTLNGFTRYHWRVSAQSFDGSSIGEYSSSRFFTTILDTPIVVAPADNVIELPTTSAFAWRRTGFAETYRLEIATNDTFAAPVFVDSTLMDSARTVGPLPGMTSYYWRVRAQNPADTSQYSRTRFFRTTIGTPRLVYPVNGFKQAPLIVPLTWDPVPGAARYRVQLATDTLMTALLIDDSLVALPAYTTFALERLRTYYWRVRAKSADGLSIGAYSGTWSFVTVPPAPLAPVLVSPADAITNHTRTPVLKWRTGLRAETYGLQIALDTSFTTMVLSDSTIADTTYQPAPLQGLLKFYWRVRSINPGGTSAYSSRWSFTTIIATPMAVSPPQAAPDQPSSVRLIWSSVPRVSTYRLQLSADSLLRTFLVDDSTLVDTMRQVSGLARSTLYYWRVRAKAAAGVSLSPYSTTQTFVTVIDTPGVPVPVLPAHAARNVSVTPTLSWRPSPRAAQYRVQVAADSVFEFVIFQDSTVTDTSRQLAALDHFATYFWRVRASNIGGVSPYSAVKKFQTVIDTPTPVAPPNFATGQPVATTVRWSAVVGATRYRLIVAPDSLLRNPMVEDSLITGNTRVVSGLQNYTTYFWRVQGRSSDGISISPTSPIWRFTTITDKPAQPVLLSPANGSQGGSNGIVLAWEPSSRSERYHLQIAQDSLFAVLTVNDSTILDSIFSASMLQTHTRYWWRVRGNNLAGSGPFSAAWSFTTAIGTPDLLAPADSATDVVAPVTLRWQATSGVIAYHLQVALDSLMTNFLKNDSTVTGQALDIPVLDPFTKYYWRVRALDAKGAGAFSAVHWFMTQLIPPRAPVQTSPVSGMNPALTTQTFRWHPARLADLYELQLSFDSPFDSTVYANATLRDTSCAVPTLLNNMRYFWRVRGINAKGAGAFSEVWSLTTIVASPAVPELVTPASGSRDHTPVLTLAWKPSPHADSYHLQVSSDVPFSTTVFEDSSLTDTTRRVGPLDYKATYYWRVRAKNSGWRTDWSPVRSITIMNPPVVFDLFQNYPNPCNPATLIRYDVPVLSEISLILYDLLGQKVLELVNENQKPGRYDVQLDVRNLPSGVFFYRLITRPVPGPTQPPTDPISFTKKLMILR